ncbi:TBC1 domain family member 30-like [Ciona intestinalis]
MLQQAHTTGNAVMVQSLLSEIYNRYQFQKQFDSSTETSCLSDGIFSQSQTFTEADKHQQTDRKLQKSFLESAEAETLLGIKSELDERISVMSAKLVRQLKQRNRLKDKHKKFCDTITAVLQATSQKRRVDANLKFNLEPQSGEEGFKQWYDALRALVRLPNGLPNCWRKKIWLCLAENYLDRKFPNEDWKATVSRTFSDRICENDENLGNQIVKDLHRTGYAGIDSSSNYENQMVLKRVLLAYARWNQAVGYCQGFNVLASLILHVTDGDEIAAFKIMVHLVDGVLPENYFANNLQALSVDMAVFRDLLRARLPQLSKHLDSLQREANENSSSYEPPLTNVFTMQWFLTLFATCLPPETVLRIWDCIMLDGNEILMRVALAIWAKLGEKVGEAQSADEFYCAMAELMQSAVIGKLVLADDIIRLAYRITSFPFPHLSQLREKYTYNITPFAAENSDDRSADENQEGIPRNTSTDINNLEEPPFFCFTGLTSTVPLSPTNPKMKSMKQQSLEHLPSRLKMTESHHQHNSMMSERMSTNIAALKHQYMTIRQRQLNAHLVYGKPSKEKRNVGMSTNPIDIPVVMNHLLVGRKQTKLPITAATVKSVQIQDTGLGLPKVRRKKNSSNKSRHSQKPH